MRCKAVKTWLTEPEASITLSWVPGKNSLARLSCSLAPDWLCSSDMLAPPLPMILPAAGFDIKNLAMTFCSPALGVLGLTSLGFSSATALSFTFRSANFVSIAVGVESPFCAMSNGTREEDVGEDNYVTMEDGMVGRAAAP